MLNASDHSARRAVRRATRTLCHAVGLEGFRLLGERTLDLSPRGMLIACDGPVQLGEEVMVSFRAPGRDGIWMDAEGEVARVIEGLRPNDPGYCMGIDFTYFERSARVELLSRLAGTPPPVPQRRLRSARDRDSSRFGPVLVHGIIPLTNRKYPVPGYPLGAFSA
jgi:hypothetical protein